MSIDALTPSDCQLVIDDLEGANHQDQEPGVFRQEFLPIIRQRENIIAKLKLKARAASAERG